MRHRFLEAVLAVKNIADIIFEAGQAALVAHFEKDILRFRCERKGAVVVADHDVRMNGRGDGASDALLIFGLLEEFFGFDVESNSTLIFAAFGKNVGLDALALSK